LIQLFVSSSSRGGRDLKELISYEARVSRDARKRVKRVREASTSSGGSLFLDALLRVKEHLSSIPESAIVVERSSQKKDRITKKDGNGTGGKLGQLSIK